MYGLSIGLEAFYDNEGTTHFLYDKLEDHKYCNTSEIRHKIYGLKHEGNLVEKKWYLISNKKGKKARKVISSPHVMAED